jgi:hypothetical protein
MYKACREDHIPEPERVTEWGDALPAGWRSEAFAEDLPEVVAPVVVPLGPVPPPGRRAEPSGRR